MGRIDNGMSEDITPGGGRQPFYREVEEMPPEQRRRYRQPPDKPSWAERADTFTAMTLRAWLRICVFVLSALGLWVAAMLVSRPESISPTIRLIERIISSGRGFAIPALVLVTLLPRLIRLLPGRQD